MGTDNRRAHRNEYRAMLTWGMMGTPVYFEDRETYTHISEMMKVTSIR